MAESRAQAKKRKRSETDVEDKLSAARYDWFSDLRPSDFEEASYKTSPTVKASLSPEGSSRQHPDLGISTDSPHSHQASPPLQFQKSEQKSLSPAISHSESDSPSPDLGSQSSGDSPAKIHGLRKISRRLIPRDQNVDKSLRTAVNPDPSLLAIVPKAQRRASTNPDHSPSPPDSSSTRQWLEALKCQPARSLTSHGREKSTQLHELIDEFPPQQVSRGQTQFKAEPHWKPSKSTSREHRQPQSRSALSISGLNVNSAPSQTAPTSDPIHPRTPPPDRGLDLICL
ncbi:MAG: hypothetical protein Q9219_007130 [cf. Caloplaca sp. 3 TL-2023]